MRKLWVVVLFFLLVLPCLAREGYKIVDLDVSAQSSWSGALGINNRGQVVGKMLTANGWHGFIWSNHKLIDIGEGAASAINDEGEVVRLVKSATGNIELALWHNGTVTIPPQRFPSKDWILAQATSINNSGQIVGGAVNPPTNWRAFCFDSLTGIFSILLSPGITSAAASINNFGEIAGIVTYYDSGWRTHACLWKNNSVTNLGTLDGYHDSYSMSVNDQGEVVGYAFNYYDDYQAFVIKNSEMVPLGFLQDTSKSRAYDINNHGEIVGKSWGAITSAFLYSNGEMIDLATLVKHNPQRINITEATSINDDGDITVNGIVKIDGVYTIHGYLLKKLGPKD